MTAPAYRGRLAPSPTGWLHAGHAATFWIAQQRAREAGGRLILRVEDLDIDRCRPEFAEGLVEDLRGAGFAWDEGPDVGGPFAPYVQSQRRGFYEAAFEQLRAVGWIYPCSCSRKDVLAALSAPHAGDDEPVYPGLCRPQEMRPVFTTLRAGVSWRFRVPHGEEIGFEDERLGAQSAVAGTDFGDFVVWRRDDVPAYQLAVVADDHAMEITEVVRGEDLLASTFRQLLLYEALAWKPPAFFHCPLVLDEHGHRMAKRHDSLSLRALRARGIQLALHGA